MPPKAQFSKQQILDAALKISINSGISTLTVRKIAGVLGCSVAPIYVNFKNTDSLLQAVMDQIRTILWKYSTKSYTDIGFFNIGIGQILFAKDYPFLFLDLLNHDDNCLEIPEEQEVRMLDIMEEDSMLEGLSRKQNRDLLQKMSIFTYGLSVSLSKKQTTLSIEDAIRLLEETAHQLILSYKENFLAKYVHLTQIDLY